MGNSAERKDPPDPPPFGTLRPLRSCVPAGTSSRRGQRERSEVDACKGDERAEVDFGLSALALAGQDKAR